MTQEALDLLAQLTDIGTAEAEELKRGRSNFRSPLIKFKADIPKQSPVVEHETINGRDNAFFMMELANVVVKDSAKPVDPEGPFALKIRLPRANAKGETKMNFNSETAQMLTSLKAHVPAPNVTAFFGLKDVEFEERVHSFPGSEAQGDGTFIDKQMDVRYYHVLKVGGAITANGNTPAPAAKPSDAAIQRALDTIKAAGEAGIVETEFNVAATKGNADKTDDRAMMKYLTENTLLKDYPAQVLRDGDRLVWVS